MENDLKKNSTTDGLPIAPSLGPSLEATHIHVHSPLIDQRVCFLILVACCIAVAATGIAQILTRLIGLITNLSFYGKFSTEFSSPAENTLGLWVIVVPVIGSILVGIMARYGSKAIRGHGTRAKFPHA
jgi:H+/Cl- antiporter ClcA